MSDYFLLEVYAHDVEFDTALGPVVQDSDTTRTPYALAFQFLDYPLLLAYAQPGPSFGSGSVIRFSTGKSCVLLEEAEELQYVLEKVSVGGNTGLEAKHACTSVYLGTSVAVLR